MSTATYQREREREPIGNNTKTQKKKNVYDSGLRKDMFTLFYGAAKVLNSSASCIKTVSPFFLCCKRVARQLQVKLFRYKSFDKGDDITQFKIISSTVGYDI